MAMFASKDPRDWHLSTIEHPFRGYQLEENPATRESFFHFDHSSFACAFQAAWIVGPAFFTYLKCGQLPSFILPNLAHYTPFHIWFDSFLCILRICLYFLLFTFFVSQFQLRCLLPVFNHVALFLVRSKIFWLARLESSKRYEHLVFERLGIWCPVSECPVRGSILTNGISKNKVIVAHWLFSISLSLSSFFVLFESSGSHVALYRFCPL